MEKKRLLLLVAILPGMLCSKAVFAEMTVNFNNNTSYYIHFNQVCGDGSGPAVIQPKQKGTLDIYTDQACSFSIDKTAEVTSDIGKGYVEEAVNNQEKFHFYLIPTIRPDMLPKVAVTVDGASVAATSPSSVIFPLGSASYIGALDTSSITLTVQSKHDAAVQNNNKQTQGIAGLLQMIGS